MHVAIITDEERLMREHRTLSREAIGLISEGVQVTRIVPELTDETDLHEEERRIALAARVEAPFRVLPWMRRDRSARLAEALEKSPPDVLYAVGEEAWALGSDLARAIERPLAVDVWSGQLVRRAPRGRHATAVAGYIAPTAPIAEALRERVDPDLVSHVPMGIAIPKSPRRVLADPERSVALAIIGGGLDLHAYRTLLTGLSRVIRLRPHVQAFLELDGPNDHEIWRHAQRLELLSNLSTITDAAKHRSLITRCDILLKPEQHGELRSVLLEAMAYGLPVIAGADPFLDMLIDGKTASVVERPDSERWFQRLTKMLDDPDGTRTLGLAGRAEMVRCNRSSDQIEMLLATFQRILTGDVIPFDSAETS